LSLNNFSLKNKTVLITGGSSGIGAEIAKECSLAGARVIIIARNEKKLISTSKKINKISKFKSKYYVCDLNNLENFKKIVSSIPKIDTYINNAGINIPKHFLKVKIDEFDKIINLNLRSVFLTTQIVVRKMITNYKQQNSNKSIINISSTLGHVGSYDRTAYTMSKFGIEGFTKSLAIDLAKYKIRVNSIAPTAIMTPMLKKYFNNNFKKKTLPNILLNRIGNVDDVASSAVFLASNAAKFITGTSILVDGGWTAK